VIWITGLAGSGKTTLGELIFTELSPSVENLIVLDGDELRTVFPGSYGYSRLDKEFLAGQYSKLCHLLSNKGVNVICTTISMYHKVRQWNRENIEDYIEIYVKVPLEVLIERDQKALYSRALMGQIDNVIGINEEFEEPLVPDVVLTNDGAKSLDEIAKEAVRMIKCHTN